MKFGLGKCRNEQRFLDCSLPQRSALQQGLALAPDQPLLLNFMGYAKLEHHEDLDAAEAMIRKASELAPDDASITRAWLDGASSAGAERLSSLVFGTRRRPHWGICS